MTGALWSYELRRSGWLALGTPPLALAALVALAALASRTGFGAHVDRILSAGLDVLPLVGGIAAAGTVDDPALELQLTCPTAYWATVARRLTVALAWAGLLALVDALALGTSGRLVWPAGRLAAQLLWLAPLLWLAGVGLAVSLGLHAAAAGSGVVGLIWVFEQVFGPALFARTSWLYPLWLFAREPAPADAHWPANRAVLLASALACFGLAGWWLTRAERLLMGAER